MAITEHFGDQAQLAREKPVLAQDPLIHLAALHEEAEETAHLANLLGRCAPAMATLVILAGGALALAGLARPAENTAWAVLMLLGILAMFRVRHRAIAAPFARGPLQAFAQDLNAVLLYAGFAWGAGAFLLLPADSSLLFALGFAILPTAALALLLKERACLFAFLTPVAGLCALAALLRPLPGGALEAGLILLGLAAISGTFLLAGEHKKAALPAFSAQA